MRPVTEHGEEAAFADLPDFSGGLGFLHQLVEINGGISVWKGKPCIHNTRTGFGLIGSKPCKRISSIYIRESKPKTGEVFVITQTGKEWTGGRLAWDEKPVEAFKTAEISHQSGATPLPEPLWAGKRTQNRSTLWSVIKQHWNHWIYNGYFQEKSNRRQTWNCSSGGFEGKRGTTETVFVDNGLDWMGDTT